VLQALQMGKATLTVSQSLKDKEPVNLTNTLDFYNETDCVMNFNEYKIRLLHYNVQSLNNKLLDIAVMLTAENLNVNILFYGTLVIRSPNESPKY
jgi:hypothetical protein